MHLPYVAHVHILETEKVEWEGNGPHSRTEEEEGSKIYTRGAISTNDGKGGGVSQARRRQQHTEKRRDSSGWGGGGSSNPATQVLRGGSGRKLTNARKEEETENL